MIVARFVACVMIEKWISRCLPSFARKEEASKRASLRNWKISGRGGGHGFVGGSRQIRQAVTALTLPFGHYRPLERSPHFLTLLQLLLARGAMISLSYPHICLKITSWPGLYIFIFPHRCIHPCPLHSPRLSTADLPTSPDASNLWKSSGHGAWIRRIDRSLRISHFR